MHRISLKEVRLNAMIATGVGNNQIFKHDVPVGQRLTDIGIGVVIENPGKPDILLYPSILVSAVTLEDKQWSRYGMSEEQIEALPKAPEPPPPVQPPVEEKPRFRRKR